MIDLLPWVLTAVFAILSILFWAAMRDAVIKKAMLSEFIAIAMLEPVVHKNNSAVFIKWLSEQNLADDANSLMSVHKAAEQIATSFVKKLGPIQGLRANLFEHKYLKDEGAS